MGRVISHNHYAVLVCRALTKLQTTRLVLSVQETGTSMIVLRGKVVEECV